MSDWLNEFPFAWLLIAALALSYIAATAIYTRVMMFVIDRRGNVPIPRPEAKKELSTVEWPTEISPSDRPLSQIVSAGTHNLHATEAGWDRLTPADLEQARRALAARRAEALTRHAEELRVLDAEQAEIDAIERSLDWFEKRYKANGKAVSPGDAG